MQRTRNQHVSYARLVAGGGFVRAADALRWASIVRFKRLRALAWLMLIGAPLLLGVSYSREFLLVDSCLDGGASFDYLRMVCDPEVGHAFVPYSQRHGGFMVATSLAILLAAAYLIITRSKARFG